MILLENRIKIKRLRGRTMAILPDQKLLKITYIVLAAIFAVGVIISIIVGKIA